MSSPSGYIPRSSGLLCKNTELGINTEGATKANIIHIVLQSRIFNKYCDIGTLIIIPIGNPKEVRAIARPLFLINQFETAVVVVNITTPTPKLLTIKYEITNEILFVDKPTPKHPKDIAEPIAITIYLGPYLSIIGPTNIIRIADTTIANELVLDKKVIDQFISLAMGRMNTVKNEA